MLMLLIESFLERNRQGRFFCLKVSIEVCFKLVATCSMLIFLHKDM